MDEIEGFEVLHRRVLGAFRRKANRSGAKDRMGPKSLRSTGTTEGKGSCERNSSHISKEHIKYSVIMRFSYGGKGLCGE